MSSAPLLLLGSGLTAAHRDTPSRERWQALDAFGNQPWPSPSSTEPPAPPAREREQLGAAGARGQGAESCPCPALPANTRFSFPPCGPTEQLPLSGASTGTRGWSGRSLFGAAGAEVPGQVWHRLPPQQPPHQAALRPGRAAGPRGCHKPRLEPRRGERFGLHRRAAPGELNRLSDFRLWEE